MCRYEAIMSVYKPHMNSLQWKMWPGALVHMHSTLLAYTPEQICLPYYTCMSQCTLSMVYIHTDPTLLHKSIKNQQTAKDIYHTTAKYVAATNVPLKCQIYATCPNYSMCIDGKSMPINMLHRNPRECCT